MSISYQENVPLQSLSTFRMGGIAKHLVVLENENDVVEYFSNPENCKNFIILGGGSNVVFPDGDFDKTIIRYTADSISIGKKEDDNVEVISDAGASWDRLVDFAVKNSLSGIEALSAIPGCVGSTPIQNVGAYGSEIKDTMISLRAYDYIDKKFVSFSNEECKFGYRDSVFKNEAKGRYLITSITFLLSLESPDVPQYPGVAEYLAKNDIRRATLADIRNAIISIRANKLPDPREIASVGSFFKNPIVSKEKGEQLKKDFPNLAVFPVNEMSTKIGAGSMIDGLGWKGKSFGTISIYKGNALVLVNEGDATRKELADVVENIISEVEKKYGVMLSPEPELL
jgi:UDP-N-acetylmuramate dehydrogenase